MNLKRLLVLSLAVALLSGCSYLFPPEEELLAPPLIEPEEITYRTMEVVTGPIEEKIEVYANFSASLTASLAFEGQGGRVSEVAVKLGQEVKEGDMLVELNSETLRRQIRQQEVEVEKAQLNLSEAKRVEEKRPKTYDMGAIEKAKINLEMEQNTLKQMEYEAEKVYRKNETWEIEQEWRRKIEAQDLVIKKVKVDLKTAEDAYTRWLEEQEGEDQSAATREARIKQAELDLRKASNTLDDLKGDLKKAQLFAPIDGVVTYVLSGLEVGQNVEGYTTLYRISDPTQLRLVCTGESAHSFTAGMDVTVTIDRETYKGKVATDPQTMPTVEGKVVSEAHFVVDGMDKQVRMGEGARVSAVLRSEENAIVIPKTCVNSFWGRKFVNLLVDGVKVEQDVGTGIETSTLVQITEGLKVGDTVILP